MAQTRLSAAREAERRVKALAQADSALVTTVKCGLIRNGYRRTDMEKMLDISAATYSTKMHEPSSLSIRQLRIMVEKLQLTKDDVWAIMGGN